MSQFNNIYFGVIIQSMSNKFKLRSSPSPFKKQKLSAQARRDKAARDLAYAKTPARRKKKADSQRRRRANPLEAKDKDWDHKDGRWETPARNRSNDGEGTKKESGKNYKI